jgi:hypothetical protein
VGCKTAFFGTIAPLCVALEAFCGFDAPLFSFVQSPIIDDDWSDEIAHVLLIAGWDEVLYIESS